MLGAAVPQLQKGCRKQQLTRTLLVILANDVRGWLCGWCPIAPCAMTCHMLRLTRMSAPVIARPMLCTKSFLHKPSSHRGSTSNLIVTGKSQKISHRAAHSSEAENMALQRPTLIDTKAHNSSLSSNDEVVKKGVDMLTHKPEGVRYRETAGQRDLSPSGQDTDHRPTRQVRVTGRQRERVFVRKA